jgi:hypothetical protein
MILDARKPKGRYYIEYEPRVDWGDSRWGIKRHRRGCYVKLGRRGLSVWWRNVR